MEDYMTDKHIFEFSQHNDQLMCFNIHQMSVVNTKTYNLQTQKYDVSVTSPVAKNIEFLHRWNTSFLANSP